QRWERDPSWCRWYIRYSANRRTSGKKGIEMQSVSGDEAAHRPPRSITLRAIALGIPLVANNAYWVTMVEVRWYTLDGTSLPLFITPIFFLFCLAAANLVVRRIRPALAFSQGELLTVYIMLVTGSCLASHDLIQNLFGSIAHPDR